MAHLESGHRGFCLVSLLGTERIVIANREKKFSPPRQKKKPKTEEVFCLGARTIQQAILMGLKRDEWFWV